MKKILYAVAGLALLASCSTEEIVELGNQSAITFAEAYVENATRAIDGSYTMDNLQSFKVYGTLTTNKGQGDVVNIFPGVPVNKNGSEWTYEYTTQYWIEGNDYKFRAIAGQNINVWADINTGMANKIEVANIADVNDILLAEENVYFREGMTPETVGFTFSHLLSKVKFTVRVKETANNYTYRVSGIAIDNTNVKGTYNIEDDEWINTTPGALSFGDAVTVGTNDASAEAIKIASGEAAESLYERQVIPATYTDMAISFQLEVLHGNTVVSTKQIVHKVNGNTVLQAGNAYNFVLEFGAPGEDIEFTVNGIDPWVDNTVVSTASALQAEINAATEPITLVLNEDMDLDNTTITVGTGKDVTLDLNGKTISGTNDVIATFPVLVNANGGTLTVKNGTVNFIHDGANMGWNGGIGAFNVTNGGVLNMENVTVNTSGTDMNFCVHLNNWGEVTLNANNCVFNATYCGVRVNNSGYDMNNVTITNSTLKGASRAFWVHNYIGDLNSNNHSNEAINARLNLDIFNENGNNNTFEITGTAISPIRYGFNIDTFIDPVTGGQIVTTAEEMEKALANPAVETIVLSEGVFTLDNYSSSNAKETLHIIGNGNTKVEFANLQVRAELYDEFIIENCEILRMPNKSWGMLVFSSSNNANGVYTIKNCTFNGQGTQGIFINETVSGATYNIVDCTFNGDFGSEGAITIQNNADVAHIVNVTGCTFNNIPDTSHKISIHYAYEGWTLNTDLAASDIYCQNY